MPITWGIYTPTGYSNYLQIIYMYATIGFQSPSAEHMLTLVVVGICGTECMLVLVAVDIYFCLMLTLRSVNPSLDQIYQQLLVMLINCLVGKLFMHF